ncbi:MAG: hypothetical protein KDK45_04555 [Leptospiraceae bacterium]|nr:hypothetical protein [Leptospiraceae bacterium]
MSTLFNQRMLLLLKGTYASDNPLGFDEYNNGTGQLYLDDAGDGLDPAFDLGELPYAKDLPIFIDIGEVRISSKYREGFAGIDGITSISESKKFWDFIAPYRQVYCNVPYGLGKTGCEETGYFQIVDFFNGSGAKYPSVDPTAETINQVNGTQYYYAGVYFRSFVTGWAKEQGAQLTNERFDNYEVSGSNIIYRTNYDPGTIDAEKESRTPAMFPLFYALQPGQKDMEIRAGYDPFILEIRMNIKENLMVHSYNTPLGVDRTMVAFSDWRKEHKGELDMGGNLLIRSRVIYPEFAARLYISGGTKSRTHYYAIYRKEEVEVDPEIYLKQLPLAASPVQNGSSEIKYIHEGDYKLFCLGDLTRLNGTSLADGYPETKIRETEFNVPSFPVRQQINVELSCP